MPGVQKLSVALTSGQAASLKAAVKSGEYATSSEIVREALRDWQQKRELSSAELKRLRLLWREGKQSPAVKNVDLSEVRREARQRLKANRRPQANAG